VAKISQNPVKVNDGEGKVLPAKFGLPQKVEIEMTLIENVFHSFKEGPFSGVDIKVAKNFPKSANILVFIYGK
jgi:hypothetical protein